MMEYRTVELNAMTSIENMERAIKKIKHQMDMEVPLRDEVKSRVASVRGLEHEKQEEIETLMGELRVEEDRQKMLSLEIQKRQFRGTIQKGRRLVLK